MEKERVSKLATIAAASLCIVAVSAAILYSQRLQRKLRLLLEEEKPQKRFKCVLADNSTRPFLHLPSPDTGESLFWPIRTEVSLMWTLTFFCSSVSHLADQANLE